MQFTDAVKAKGWLSIRVLDAKTRKELRRVHVANTVCVGAKEALQRLLVQNPDTPPPESPAYHQLWAIYAGTDNTPPQESDTALYTVVAAAKKQCDHKRYNVGGTTGLTEVQMTLEASEANGVTLREAGLFSRGTADSPAATTGAYMYARQIHGNIDKTSALAIEYTWRFQILSA